MRVLLLTLSLALSVISSAQVQTLLIARNTGKKTLDDGKVITTMGFAKKLSQNPDVPGPTLVYFEGDSVTIDLWNVSQGAPHTIHLHGLDVDQQNDGVPHLSFSVGHMEHGYYKFMAPHPGTYLYHCHVVSAIHVQAGMYGMLIVKPKNAPNLSWNNGYEYARDFNYTFSEIDTLWHHDSVLEHSIDHMRVKIPDYNPSYFLANGLSGKQLYTSEIQIVKDKYTYLRLANIGYYGNRLHFPSDVEATIIDSDGRPLPKPYKSQSLYIFPGERYGVLLKAQQLMSDSIIVDYLNLNTRVTKGNASLKLIVTADAGIFEPNNNGIQFYPNPVRNELQIESNYHKMKHINVIDVSGKQILGVGDVSESFRTTLNTMDWKAGLYVVQIEFENGHKCYLKLLK
jgi:FtsP/CotA-like multicopper oxidase with cupredoxin domain